jgi:hypothetical protein
VVTVHYRGLQVHRRKYTAARVEMWSKMSPPLWHGHQLAREPLAPEG